MATIISSSVTADAMLNQAWLEADQMKAVRTSSYAAQTLTAGAFLEAFLSSQSKSMNDLKAEVYVCSTEVTALLINQAVEFLQMSLCNVIAHHLLSKAGLDTWARVTNYYAGYFAVHGLLNIQGRSLTRIKLDKESPVFLIAVDLSNHNYSITTKHVGRNPHHQTPWVKFYDIYDRYATPHAAFDLVTKKAHVSDPADESHERNSINYKPFIGFEEIRSLGSLQIRKQAFVEYEQALLAQNTRDDYLLYLSSYATDPDCRYFARSLLKIGLIADRLLLSTGESPALKAEWDRRMVRWREFIGAVYPDPDSSYIVKFLRQIRMLDA